MVWVTRQMEKSVACVPVRKTSLSMKKAKGGGKGKAITSKRDSDVFFFSQFNFFVSSNASF